MKKINTSFVLAMLFSALFLAVFVALSGLAGRAFARQPTLQLLYTVSQFAAGLAALGLLVAAGVVAVRAALQPGSWWRSALGVLPTFCLGLLLAGVVFQLAGIGTVGTFTMSWLVVSGLLAIAATINASALVVLDRASLRRASVALAVAGAFSVPAWLAIIVGVVLFLLNPAGGPSGGGPGGGPGGPPPGFGAPGGPRGPTQFLLTAGGLLTLLGVLAWVTIVRVWRNSRTPAAETGPVNAPANQMNGTGAAGRAAISLAAITAVVFVAIQFVPVSKTNAPVQTPVTWDTPQDEALFRGACGDCHSNETVRPWYDYIAPSSWLLASHISGAHARWNLSEINNLSPDDKSFLPDQIANALHSNVMPPGDYQMMHPSARLTAAEKDQLINALKTVLSK